MTVQLVQVNAQNRAVFDALAVQAHQEDLIADNAAWLDEALPFENSLTCGIMAGDVAIGLGSLTDTRTAPAATQAEFFQSGCAYLWRFMIDASAQGRGYGHAALALLEDKARALGEKGLSLTTADRTLGNALDFYTVRGYRPTGRRLHDEIELIKLFEGTSDA